VGWPRVCNQGHIWTYRRKGTRFLRLLERPQKADPFLPGLVGGIALQEAPQSNDSDRRHSGAVAKLTDRKNDKRKKHIELFFNRQ
jgi:hypothetical protein